MMRTPTLVLALLALAVAPVAAQSGIKLVCGLVSAKFSQEIDGESFDDGITNRSGFAIGLGLSRAIGTSLSFSPELLYAVKGGKDDDSDEDQPQPGGRAEEEKNRQPKGTGGRMAAGLRSRQAANSSSACCAIVPSSLSASIWISPS